MRLWTAAAAIASSMKVNAESIPPASSYTTNGAVVIWGALTLNQALMIIGTVLAVATFMVNLHFQRRRDKREQEFHGRRMKSKPRNVVDGEDHY